MQMNEGGFSAPGLLHRKKCFVRAAPLVRLEAYSADSFMPGTPHPQWSVLFGLLLFFCMPVFSAAQENTKADPRNVEAAFLRNFAHYVTWPSGVFADDRTPWRICILGNDPFGKALDNTLDGRTEQGRPFVISRAATIDPLHQCQIVYVAYTVSASRRAALAQLKGKPILTVSNAPGFLQEGGIVRFQVTDYVEMSVNLDQARAASLTIQTKMLEVSNDVVENGVVRKMR